MRAWEKNIGDSSVNLVICGARIGGLFANCLISFLGRFFSIIGRSFTRFKLATQKGNQTNTATYTATNQTNNQLPKKEIRRHNCHCHLHSHKLDKLISYPIRKLDVTQSVTFCHMSHIFSILYTTTLSHVTVTFLTSKMNFFQCMPQVNIRCHTVTESPKKEN